MTGLSALLTLAAASAHAAPTVELSPEALQVDVPSQVSILAPVPGARPTSPEALEQAFGLGGRPGELQTLDLYGGLDHSVSEGVHVWSYAAGGDEVHDTLRLKSERTIDPRSPDEVLLDAELLLAELGLFEVEGVDLQPARVGARRITRRDEQGALIEEGITAQSAHYLQTFEGLPGVGGGATVDLVFDAEGDIAGLSHAVRPVQVVGVSEVLPVEAAAAALQLRAEETGRFNLLKHGMAHPERLVIDRAELAVFVPDATQVFETYEPVWALSGRVVGTDHEGVATEQELQWIEPAVSGRDLPALSVFPLR